MSGLPSQDHDDIRRLLLGLNRGNPGSDAEVRDLFRRRLAEPDRAGLPPDLVSEMEAAVTQDTAQRPDA